MSTSLGGELVAMDVASRLPLVRRAFSEAGCDGLLVDHLVNIRYLTGFTGSAAHLLVTPRGAVFVTDGRYTHQAEEQLARSGVDARIEIAGANQRAVLRRAATRMKKLAIESEHVSWAQVRSYGDQWFPRAELVPTAGLVEKLRLVKDAGEIARIEAAATIADSALASVRGRLLEEPTEEDFALELDTAMRRLGATGPSFETIVASGPNGARPHHRPAPRRIVEGDLVVIDFGATVDGYRSDMTRTVMVGQPGRTQKRMLRVVLESQAAGVAAVRAGVAARDVDRAAREVISDAGWGDAYVHGTGHGVGLDIHEAPRVAGTSDATLAAGHVVTVEPGVYLPRHGGVRIEDTVVVTEDGCRPLTTTPKHTAVA